jgi:hypothetical protein
LRCNIYWKTIVTGLQAQLGRHVGAAPVDITLALDVKALTGAAQAAVDAAGPTVNYSWPVLIGVDGTPTTLALVYNGQELPIQACASLSLGRQMQPRISRDVFVRWIR